MTEIKETKTTKRIKDNIITLVEQHVITKSKHPDQWKECDRLCFLAKNLYNQALYRIKQHYIETNQFLPHRTVRNNMRSENQLDFRSLPSWSAGETIALLGQNFKSFFASIKDYSKNPSKYKAKPKLPKYLDKTKGRYALTFGKEIGIKNNLINFPKKVNLLPLRTKVLPQQYRQVRIIPKSSCYVIEVIYEQNKINNVNLNYNHFIGIDLGINNLCAISSNKPGIKPLLINGRVLKSINQHSNKQLAKAQSYLKNQNRKSSNRTEKILLKRNNSIKTYLHQTSKLIIDHCIDNNIGNIVIGLNKGWKQDINIGKVNNQKFVQIPFNTLINQITYKANLVGINVKTNEESYTSKCSALDLEELRNHDEDGYKGKRIKRGLFKTSNNQLINADINGSLNILRKVIGDEFLSNMAVNAVQPLSITPGNQK